MKIEHALIAVSPDGKILHLIAYENASDFIDYFHMIEEISTDEQFGLTHLAYGKDYVITPADKRTLEMIMETVNERPEDFEVVEHGLKVTE